VSGLPSSSTLRGSRKSLLLPHGLLPLDPDHVRVVDHSVQNGVGDHSLSYLRVPSFRSVLRAEDGGGDSEPRLH